ncbi:coatomer subunit beta [Ophidiomyces ophidiicola]|nr:coatomer subunit beta [Ophidiomyces ophidiicola]KAI2132916.1 coatomer subunit beta [Ophidiomyces ophidiicola]KAI2211588.1 coatomer subunit beta [Ophidiomyces ophidiicola]KAI2454107.1 coatomer subunit beta [Ophidiomyces ophidiicola]
MALYLENAYSLVHQDNSADQPTLQELKTQLEKGTDESKMDTMRRILTIMLNGDPMPQLLMHIIRFVMPSKCKPLKKLLYFYYEICPKLDASGKLKQEMILVCNGIRNDLQHPNEYIRGNTLRFLCKLREPELLEPLLSSARLCLDYRHAYVRKSAVWAIASIFQHSETLIPDAPDLLFSFLEEEADRTCKRNAFAALLSISHQKALEYLNRTLDGFPHTDELLQLAGLEFIRKDALQNSQNKAIVYEAATSLTALTSNPVAVKAAAAKLIELSIREPDNNVKLIVLDRVDQLRVRNEGVLEDLTMEILRVLSSPDIDVRRKALGIALEMISSKNVEEIVLLLKKELSKTVDEQYEKNNEYRQLLIQSIHQCAIKFSEIAASVVDLLMDFIADLNNNSAIGVITFVKEVVEKFPNLRQSILERLVSTLREVRTGRVYRGVLWVIGEYSLEQNDIREAWKHIRASLGEIPILASEQRLLDEDLDEAALGNEQINGHSKPSTAPKVLADGTYAQETALTSQSAAATKLEAVKAAYKPPLRQLILDGDYFLATVLSSTLTKLVMRHSDVSQDTSRTNALQAEAMLIMISILQVGQSQFVKAHIDEDSVDRIMSCVQSLAEFTKEKELEVMFLEDTRQAFRAMVQVEERKREAKEAVEKAKAAVQVDSMIPIRQFARKSAGDDGDEMELDLAKATGGDSALEDISSKLSTVIQLTGYSDSVYAEAYVNVHQFDIILDVLLVNQTMDTLQNLSVEFATLGDLKVVERPTTQNLGPHDFLNVQATIKVSSTDTGVIFGNIVYDGSSSMESHVVILNDIKADVMDYIQPAHCTEIQFRSMWTEFEWENKVDLLSKGRNLLDFLQQIMKRTNMSCLTPEASLEGDCQFLSANLYAKSIFGEDALANKPQRHILPYFYVLWAEVTLEKITISYAEPTSADDLSVMSVRFELDAKEKTKTERWIEQLLQLAYGKAQRQKRIKVLINPFGGKGRAKKLFDRDVKPVFTAARCMVDVQMTTHQGHAVEIAQNVNIEAYDVIAPASGDGVVHEVFNGLGKRVNAGEALAKVAVAHIPCGSGNAMSWNLYGTGSPSMAGLCIVKGLRTPLDLTSISQGDRRSLSFLSQSFGIIAESDLGTEHIRWMGSARFTYGFLVRLFGKTLYPCDLAVKVEVGDKQGVKDHYRAKSKQKLPDAINQDKTTPVGLPPLKYGTIADPLPDNWELITHEKMGNFYAGNMSYMAPNTNFFPTALPNDGLLDLVTVRGDISLLTALQMLTAVDNGTFLDMSDVKIQKVSGYRIIPRTAEAGHISIDGEKVPFEPFQAEVHRGLGMVISKSRYKYEAPGV